MSASKILTRKERAMGGRGFRRGRRRIRPSITDRHPSEPMTMETPLGTFRQPLGERGSATNPIGPRSRRRAYWVPANDKARAAVERARLTSL